MKEAAQEIEAMRQQAEDELNFIKPVVEEAKSAVKAITSSDIDNVRAY